MLIILDDVFNAPTAQAITDDYIIHKKSTDIIWCDTSYHDISKSTAPVSVLLNLAFKNFNISHMIGFEYWAHYNSGANWHFDKDEVELQTTGQLHLPLCGIVYYPLIENLDGGCFVTHHERIKPKTNRAIIFSSNLEHMVEPFSGTRLSVSINPWNRKPKAHI